MNFSKKIFIVFSVCIAITAKNYAQNDTLPDFIAIRSNEATMISWYNNYKDALVINIQRSIYSNKNFITINSISSPSRKRYLFLDKSAPADSCFYRIFILHKDNNYIFSQAKKSDIKDQTSTNTLKSEKKEQTAISVKAPTNPPIKNISTEHNTKPDELKEEVKIIEIKKNTVSNKDSASLNSIKNNKPTSENEIILTPIKEIFTDFKSTKNKNSFLPRLFYKINPKLNSSIKVEKPWQPSPFVSARADGNITITLPDIKNKKYSITFLKEEGRPLFIIPDIKQSPLIIDKTSFLKSGWYYFELRESDKVIERNKFMITINN